MTIELTKRDTSDKIGKDTTFKATFEGTYKGLPVKLVITGEDEREVNSAVPLVAEKQLNLDISDPNRQLNEFESD